MRLLFLLLLLALPAAAQELAGPRPLVVTEDTVLRLGDIFEGAGPRAAQPIGAAPAPGRRLVIEAPQLAALARAQGLPWRPVSAQERVVVERPGQAVPRDDIAAALRAELLRLGLDPEAELELGPLPSLMVPPGAPPRLLAESPSLDATSGRFAATLAVIAEGMPVLRQRIAGRALPTLAAVVATRRLSLGEVVGPGDARLLRLRAERVRPGTADQLDQVLGQQLRRPMGAEAPFLRADLGPPPLVEKNALVTMVVEAPGLALTAQGRSLEAGPRGGLVPVMNLASRTVVEGQVIGPGHVRVAMGAAPIRMAGE
ncbi:flagellar basal body P-ring formation chaperone FlgA [Paracraurococcus lichenis]|uniref:Flagellar basal body P-ring formation chaperone FlgA n=1 Tax=Paracraurococcus lichenis TaxID=3064888 RepID=A0ABT9DZQ1_9PROT|nr:flagellar basal body P-ring formation chaperone FlgA [Paracraurococcus sp. LOR1-02]MDO9709364.1 flagellar basal body P-ring formation chaperone FlgA [Paracraurococcus sp. LOR1-02]